MAQYVPRCGYLQTPQLDDTGDMTMQCVAFILMDDTPGGLIGMAPRGVLSHAEVAAMDIPLRVGGLGADPVACAIVNVSDGDVVDLQDTPAPGSIPLLFNSEGGWPDIDAAYAFYLALDFGIPGDADGEPADQ